MVIKIEDLSIESVIKVNKKDALIIIDMQNDFCPGGSLPVGEGDLIVEGINKLAEIIKNRNGIIALTQDWHPKEHLSFASNHSGKNPGDEFMSEDGAIGPVLWPDHCVQNTEGAKFHKNLKVDLADEIFQKGMTPSVDSYSGFLDNDKKIKSGLDDYLKSKNIQRIFICGLALDYCCYATAMDGVDLGYNVVFIVDLTRGVDLPPGNVDNTLKNMEKKGIIFAKEGSFS